MDLSNNKMCEEGGMKIILSQVQYSSSSRIKKHQSSFQIIRDVSNRIIPSIKRVKEESKLHVVPNGIAKQSIGRRAEISKG
ncbi:hypothetical protein TNIN_432481 [Trichonephila inaurata madagascariensis]|uniref:Uncharacterized protein n=1 Tax=Trichonephila inaurata madagascariensis TaxID=2747483 RepID=A0A8X6JJP1_9ARAC|nr:hypothetical protein TNIN_432481 [Trichonephila inaurata madagascariensis]